MHSQKHLQSITQPSPVQQEADTTTQHDKAALLEALRKPILTQHQRDKIMTRLKRANAKPPDPPKHVSLWRSYKETMAVVADGMAVWPILGVTSVFNGSDDLLYRLFTLQ